MPVEPRNFHVHAYKTYFPKFFFFFSLKSAMSLVSYSLKLPLSSSYFFTKRTVFYNTSDNSKMLIFWGSVLATGFAAGSCS